MAPLAVLVAAFLALAGIACGVLGLCKRGESKSPGGHSGGHSNPDLAEQFWEEVAKMRPAVIID
jgi:hypothetical protein